MPVYSNVDFANLKERYDYIIIGGGTAGCVLANRLSEDPNVTVLLLERGGIGGGWAAKVPLFSAHFASDFSRSKVWKSTPQKHLGERKIDLVGGNALGGSSKINATLHYRGVPGEYNGWVADDGFAKEWKYDNLEAYFVKSESNIDVHGQKRDFHGYSGEWSNRSHNKLYWAHSEHVIKASSALGLTYLEDPNSPSNPPHGCTKIHYNIDSNGYRCSTASAFLTQNVLQERSDRLHICLNVLVHRITFRDGLEGTLAEGVSFQKTDGRTHLARATREIILTAGPISSPHLMLLSGIGPQKHLFDHGIKVVKDLPGVGSHLQDHLSVPVQFQVPLGDSMVKIRARPWLILLELLLFVLFGTGILLSPVLELSLFIQSRLLDNNLRVSEYSKSDTDASNPQNCPDLEIMPISWGSASEVGKGGLTFFVVTLHPTSLGTIRLASNDPATPPDIDPNFYSTENDRAVMRKGVRFARMLGEQMRSQGYSILPFRVPKSDEDADIDEFAVSEAQSTSHYSSTCRMAPEKAGGVVDDRLRVYGVKNLRIADSSVFPEILGTHLAAGTVAVAEKCAAIVIEDWKART